MSSFTIAERHAIINKRYVVRAEAEADAALLGTNYDVRITDEGLAKYFRVVNCWDGYQSGRGADGSPAGYRPLFKGDLTPYTTRISPLFGGLNTEMSAADIEETVRKWRGAMAGYRGFIQQVHDEIVSERLIHVGTPQKPYRVFYNCGVYEWYVNTGRADLWEYQKRGELVLVYNVAADYNIVPEVRGWH